MAKSIYRESDLRMKKHKPSMRYTTRKSKPENYSKKKPIQHKFRKKVASDLLMNSSYNNPLMKLQNDMITNLSDLTKRTSRFGRGSNIAVPVMRQESSLLGGYGLERATNASKLFGNTTDVFSEYNRKLNAQTNFVEKKEEEEKNKGMFSSVTLTSPPMTPHVQTRTRSSFISGDSHIDINEDNITFRKNRKGRKNNDEMNDPGLYTPFGEGKSPDKEDLENLGIYSSFGTGETTEEDELETSGLGPVFGEGETTEEEEDEEEKDDEKKDGDVYTVPHNDIPTLIQHGRGEIKYKGKVMLMSQFSPSKIAGSYIVKGQFGSTAKQSYKEITYNPSSGEFELVRTLNKNSANEVTKTPNNQKITKFATGSPMGGSGYGAGVGNKNVFVELPSSEVFNQPHLNSGGLNKKNVFLEHADYNKYPNQEQLL